jgi:hypothetical protein
MALISDDPAPMDARYVITHAEWAATHRDFKSGSLRSRPSTAKFLRLMAGGTCLVPVTVCSPACDVRDIAKGKVVGHLFWDATGSDLDAVDKRGRIVATIQERGAVFEVYPQGIETHDATSMTGVVAYIYGPGCELSPFAG